MPTFPPAARPLLATVVVAMGAVACAQRSVPDAFVPPPRPRVPLTEQMKIEQKLGAAIPKDAELFDERGRKITFGALLKGRPVLVYPIFYRCTSYCNNQEVDLVKMLGKSNRGNEFVVGRDLDIVFLGLHPKETPELAAAEKAALYRNFVAPDSKPFWTLTTGAEREVRKITDAAGVSWSYDAKTDVLNHPACSFLLTPDGRVSAYTIGDRVQTIALRNDLALAKAGKIGDRADQSMMFGCIRLDPATGRYRVVIERTVTIFGIITLGAVLFSIVHMSRKYRSELPAEPEAK